jgi:ATP-binding cassette subfamily B protein
MKQTHPSRKEKGNGRPAPKQKPGGGIGKILAYAGEYKAHAALSCILSVISTVLALGPYIAVWFTARSVISALPYTPGLHQILTYALWAVLTAALSIALYAIALILSHLAAFRVSKNMKKAALGHISRLPLVFFTSNTSARIRRLIDENTGAAETFVSHQLPDVAGAFVLPVAVIAMLFIFDWRLGLASIAPVVLGFVSMSFSMTEKQRKVIADYENQQEALSSSAIEYVRGIPVVKIFQQTVYSFKGFYEAIMRYRGLANQVCNGMKVTTTIYTVLINAMFAFLIPAGILLYNRTEDPAGFVADFLFYLLLAPVFPMMLSKIMKFSDDIMRVNMANQNLEALMEEKPLPEPRVPQSPSVYDICFEQVSFAYPGTNRNAVDNLSFRLPQGGTLAIVGVSGSGKTTAAGLLARFFDTDSGEIKIGGINIKDIAKEDLMAKVSFVFQSTKLLKGSLAYNIAMGCGDVPRERILAAAKKAQCQDILDKLPRGIDTVYGTEGTYLSGGECQRIALARAILKDAPIVILDEATAFADPENERLIQKSFEELTKDKTLIMIAHRLTTVQKASGILVMDNGRLVEQGTHKELLSKGGAYASMWRDYQSSIKWNIKKEEVTA